MARQNYNHCRLYRLKDITEDQALKMFASPIRPHYIELDTVLNSLSVGRGHPVYNKCRLQVQAQAQVQVTAQVQVQV